MKVNEPTIVISGSAYDFQRNLGRYWRYVRRSSGVPITISNWVYKSAWKHVLSALNLPATAAKEEVNLPRVWFLRRLLTQAGVFIEDYKTDHQVIKVNAASAFFDLSLTQRIKRCFEVWRDQNVWHEVYRIPEQLEYNATIPAPPELAKARVALLGVMARLSSGNPTAWITTEHLVDEMHRAQYEFLFARRYRGRDMRGATQYFHTPYYADNNPYRITFGKAKTESQGWDIVERVAIHLFLNEPLSWMGLVDIGLSSEEQRNSPHTAPFAYRLTPVGAWLLGIGEKPVMSESGGRVIVQPNFSVLAIEPISDSALSTLDHFADVQGGDRAVSYLLTRESVYRGQRNGYDIARIVQFLEEHQGAALPPNVRRTLDEWDAQHNRIVIRRNVRVVQYGDGDARDAAQKALSRSGARAISADFDRVDDATESIMSKLQQAGWAPLHDKQNEPAPHDIAVDALGNIRFKVATPSIYTLAAVERIAQRDGARAVINQASVMRAVQLSASQSSITIDDAIREIERLNGAPLDTELAQRIRIWSGVYAGAELEQVWLVTLPSNAALQSLMSDSAISDALQIISAEDAEMPRVLIDTKKAPQILAALEKLGIS